MSKTNEVSECLLWDRDPLQSQSLLSLRSQDMLECGTGHPDIGR